MVGAQKEAKALGRNQQNRLVRFLNGQVGTAKTALKEIRPSATGLLSAWA